MSIWKTEPRPGVRIPDIKSCMEVLSGMLSERLDERGCSIVSLSKDCMVSDREISKILNGQAAGIRLSTLLKISHGLGIRASELLAKMEVSA